MSGVLGALRRRWYLLVVGLLLTAGLAVVAAKASPPEYTARELILLLPPTSEETEGANPFLNLGNLDLPARVLVASFSSNDFQADIADRAPKAEVVVSSDDSTRGPVIAVDVKDATPQSTLNTLSYVAGLVPQTLERLQAEVGVPEKSVVSSMTLTTDTRAKEDYSNFIRMLILAIAGGLALTAVITYGADNLILRRSRRRANRPRVSDDTFENPRTPMKVLDESDGNLADPVPAVRDRPPVAATKTTKRPKR